MVDPRLAGLLSPSSRFDAGLRALAELSSQLVARGAPRTTPTPPPMNLGRVMQAYDQSIQNDLQRGLALRQFERSEEEYARKQQQQDAISNMLADVQVPVTVGEPVTGETTTVMQTQPSALMQTLPAALRPSVAALAKAGQGPAAISAILAAAVKPQAFDIKKIGPNNFARFDKNTGKITPLAGSTDVQLSGTGATQQFTNALLNLGPKVADGSASLREQQLYSIAHNYLGKEKTETRIGSDGSKIIVRVPGADLSNFPKPFGAAAPSSNAQPSGEKVVSQGLPTKPTGEEIKASGFAARMETVGSLLDDLEAGAAKPFISQSQFLIGELPQGKFLQRKSMTPEQQQYATAAREWIRAKLRKESGAAIPAEEMQEEYETYFPMPGDTPQTIELKRNLRKQNTIEMRAAAAGSDLYRKAVTTRNPQASQPPPTSKDIPTADELRKKFGLKQ
tara:strand:+ start:4135 stop:5484 length:1350 start_codon:yes stop_codon:yes gene_type:complete